MPDEAIVEALRILVRDEDIAAEPAAAAGLAAVLSGAVAVPPGANVAFVISGGNVDPGLLENLRG